MDEKKITTIEFEINAWDWSIDYINEYIKKICEAHEESSELHIKIYSGKPLINQI